MKYINDPRVMDLMSVLIPQNMQGNMPGNENPQEPKTENFTKTPEPKKEEPKKEEPPKN